MTYKNTFGDYVRMGFSSGILYGVMMYLIYRNLNSAAISGVVFGILFPCGMAIVGMGANNRGKALRQFVAQSHRITCDGSAQLNGKPGWMFLCEDALVYYPNQNTQPTVIPLNQIQDVSLGTNRVILHTVSGVFKFIVTHNRQWRMQILRSIGR